MYYARHAFFCTNKKSTGKKCCHNANAEQMREYAKGLVKRQGMHGTSQVRVSASGCLGRCSEGPCVVVYPEAVWYTYQTPQDVEEIVEKHLLQGTIVDRLLLDNS